MEKDKGSVGEGLDPCNGHSGPDGVNTMEFEVIGLASAVVSANTFVNQTSTEFEELIQDIDKSIHEVHEVTNLDSTVYLPTVVREGGLVPFRNPVNDVLQDSDLVVQEPVSATQESPVENFQFSLGMVGSVGAGERGRRKGRPKCVAAKVKRPRVSGGSATNSGAMLDGCESIGEMVVGLKRKKDGVDGVVDTKKSKFDLGSVAFGSCVETSLVSAEVARQPRRVQ